MKNLWKYSFVGVVLLFLFSMTAAGLAQQQPSADPVAVLGLYIDKVWNAGQTDLLPTLLTAEHIHNDLFQPEDIIGVDAAAAYVDACRSHLAGVTFKLENPVVDGDMIFAQLKAARLTPSVEFVPRMESSTYYAAWEAATWEQAPTLTISAHFLDGRIAETWFDAAAFEARLGLSPNPTTEEPAVAPIGTEGLRWGS